MSAVATLLVVLTLSFLITRLATAALTLTGVSKELARLQAVSAFTGVGYTTKESEHVVDHPVRRRLIIVVMVLGNAGFVTAIASLMLTFIGVDEPQTGLTRLLWLALGSAVLWAVTYSGWLDRWMHGLMRRALSQWTDLAVHDYASMLHLAADHSVRSVNVGAHDWWTDRSLADLKLFQEGVMVLGIHRPDGDYIGVPRGETCIREGDRLVLYGRDEGMSELEQRARGAGGDAAHDMAVAEQDRERRDQERRDAERDREAD